MKKNSLYIYIISEDLVFVRLMEVMLKHFSTNPEIKKFHSFIELKDARIDKHPDLIILDDIVSGAASFEVISFLRLSKRIISTICFFGDDIYDIKENAIKRGANYFYNKPFDPKAVVNEIVSNLNLLPENNHNPEL